MAAKKIFVVSDRWKLIEVYTVTRETSRSYVVDTCGMARRIQKTPLIFETLKQAHEHIMAQRELALMCAQSEMTSIIRVLETPAKGGSYKSFEVTGHQ